MEPRKKEEIEYYDKKAELLREKEGDFEGFNPKELASFRFLYKLIKERCLQKVVLDYGCGNGIHALEIAKMGAEKVIGIDLSEMSLDIARERAKKERLERKTEFLKMDCEKTRFPDNFFDIVFDGGAFSSLELKKALPEIKRILKKDGLLIGVETFGHNPLTNLKRKINKLTGKRTAWAAGHIFRQGDIELAKEYFEKADVYYFHLISWIAFPFLKIPGGRLLLRFLESIDKALLIRVPFLRKYAFKVVFVFSNPRLLSSPFYCPPSPSLAEEED